MELQGSWSYNNGTLFLYGSYDLDGTEVLFHIMQSHNNPSEWVCQDFSYNVSGKGEDIEKAFRSWKSTLCQLIQ